LDADDIRAIGVPIELWPAQLEALRRGLLNRSFKSFGFASPTGTGKTALSRILIASALRDQPGGKVLYLCPSRALVHQVYSDLKRDLSGIDVTVFEAGAHLVVHEMHPIASEEADVLVFTPERADLLLRVAPEFIQETILIIVDEAHHIEQGSRGVLLEFYLWRLLKLTLGKARIVQLSAVTRNIRELTGWLGTEETSQSVLIHNRTNSLRVGGLERSSSGAAILQFGDTPPYSVLTERTLPRNPKEGLAVLADHFSKSGIVLILCMSPAIAEEIANLVAAIRQDEQPIDDEVSDQLDAWIERELFPESLLRSHYKKRVVFHHSQLPPRVRTGIEDAIREKKVDVICATTTLAEGVNFPFSTVLVESLVGTYFELTPRSLWNIAGRAGRFGVDSEGHCILFRPELWRDRLKEYRLDDYLRTKLTDIPPVESALASGLRQLEALVGEGKLPMEALESISLANIKIDGKATAEAKSIRAFINIMRVGYAHANSTGAITLLGEGTPEFDGELLASRQVTETSRVFASAIGRQQRLVIRAATAENPEFVQISARVGWSLEAQQSLYNWLLTRADWQLEQFGNIVVRGYIRNFDHLGFLVGPLAKHLIAFEGEALGGAVGFLADKWIRGIPLAGFQEARGTSFGRMISNVYGRMQYLLPWGLFGLDELIQFVARERGILVGDGVGALSALAAEGVPNFDALTLVLTFGIERVDAARLSDRFRRDRRSTDIIDWFRSSVWSEIERVVKGAEQRRLDPSLYALHSRLQHEHSPQQG
jgi:DEAD/DEAH box helicase/Helicase conserved C-terminal domain